MTADRATGLTGALRSHVGSARSDTPLSPRSRWREAGTLFRYQGGRAWGFRLDFCLFFVFSLALACVTQSCRKQVSVQFSPALNRVRPHELQHARLPCPSPTPRSLLKFMSIQWVMLSNHLILCRLLLLPPSVFPSIRVFSNESVLSYQVPKSWNFSFSISPSNDIQDSFPLGCTGWVQLSYPCMTTGETISLTRRTFVGKVMYLLFNMLSRLVITFIPRSKCLLISWLQSPSAVILELPKIVCHCFHCFPIYLPWSDGTRCHDLSFLNVEF